MAGNAHGVKGRPLFSLVAGLLVVAGAGVPIGSQAIAAEDPDACTGDAVVAPSQVNGVYNITTAGQLKHVAGDVTLWSGDFLLINDISLAACGDWVPIGNSSNPFAGDFDGDGHSISGLVINRAGQDDVGLFGYSSGASFTDVTLVGVDVTGSGQIGALVGQFLGSDETHKISGSSVTGTVVGAKADPEDDNESTPNDIGGLVGWFTSPSGVIENSFSLATVTGPSDVGGLVGEVESGSIRGSWATGAITATDTQIGGLVGDFAGDGDIDNSYATGNVTSTDSEVGGLVGDFHGTGDILNSHATGTVSGSDNVGGLVGRFEKAGKIENSYATGAVTGSAPRVGGLVGFFDGADLINGSYATGNVIGTDSEDANTGGLVGYFFSTSGSVRASYATGNVTGTGERVGGLIGWFTGGVMDATSYATGTVTGASRQIGGLIGRLGGGAISTVHSTGNVIATGETETARDVGGLVGATFRGIEIAQTYATGSVTVSSPSADGRIGGLVGGLAGEQTMLAGSFATGTVVGANYTGGLVGRVYDGALVEVSYATNSVQGADYVGGLVGGLDDARTTIPQDDDGGIVRDSYSTGSATGQNNVGGLVGFMDNAVSVITSYSTAQASGGSLVGGLVGSATVNATAERSFWDLQTSGLSTSAQGSGQTTAALKTIATYTSVTPPWDIVPATAFGQPEISSAEVWGIGAGVNCGYPFLYWQDGSGHSCPVAPAGSAREKRADSPAIAMDLEASIGDRVAGAPVVIGGEGLAANAPYTLIVRSTPTTVDSGSATALGNFSTRVSLPELPPGDHTLTLSATAPDGSTLTLVQTFTVSSAGTFSAIGQPSGTFSGGLAATGVSNASWSIGLGGAAVLAGLLMLWATRRGASVV